MKTVTTFPPPALSFRPRVKKLLITGIIHLTSDKFSIFVDTIAALTCWMGMCRDNDRIIGFGGIMFLIGFTPWALRITLREMRQNRLGLNEW